MTLIGAPAAGAVFLSWSPEPEAQSYRVRWRPSAAPVWSSMTVEVVDHALIPDLVNGVPYDFTVEAATPEGPVHSLAVQVTPKRRPACAYRTYHPIQSFFCSQADADAWMQERGVRSEDLRCRNLPVEHWGPSVRDCLYTAGTDFRMLLLRNADNEFQAPIDPPSPKDIRDALRRAIWRAGDPFSRGESGVEPSMLPAAIIGSVTKHATAGTLVFMTSDLFSSRVTRFTSRKPVEGRYAIYHEGHGGRAVEIGAETIDWLLERGWEVYAMDMPMSGVNASDMGPSFPNHHSDMYKLDDGITSPVATFMLPVKNVVDFIERRSVPNPTILMMGRSGGGWTTYTYSALDPRIDVAVSVAGGRPMSQRLDAPWGAMEIGDYEQSAPEIFAAIRHEDLMIAAGARGSMHFFNVKDPCCFRVSPGDPLVTYLVSGGIRADRTIRVFVDTENTGHSIGAAGYPELRAFLDEVLRRRSLSPGGGGLQTPCTRSTVVPAIVSSWGLIEEIAGPGVERVHRGEMSPWWPERSVAAEADSDALFLTCVPYPYPSYNSAMFFPREH